MAGRLREPVAAQLKASMPCEIEVHGEDSVVEVRPGDLLVGFQMPEGMAPSMFRWVHACGAGVDGMLGDEPWPTGTALTRTMGRLPQKMAEYCLAQVLADFHHLGSYARQQAGLQWEQLAPRELREARVLILGTGRLGIEAARTFAAFGAEVRGLNRSGRQRDGFGKVHARNDLGEALAWAEVVIALLPGTGDTRNLLSREVLANARDLLLINAGRGSLISIADLIEACEAGHVRQAVLDVFDEEPLPATSPLWSHPGIRITPHVAAVTDADDVVDSLEIMLGKRGTEAERASLVVHPPQGF